jgi:hypothetical protein
VEDAFDDVFAEYEEVQMAWQRRMGAPGPDREIAWDIIDRFFANGGAK